jgi:hypothetical protein
MRMTATEVAILQRKRELTPLEYRLLLEAVQLIIQPFASAKAALLMVCTPIMIIEESRTEAGFALSARYSPEVQAELDRVDGYCQQAVNAYLCSQGLRTESLEN